MLLHYPAGLPVSWVGLYYPFDVCTNAPYLAHDVKRRQSRKGDVVADALSTEIGHNGGPPLTEEPARTVIPTDPNALLRRRPFAVALTTAGYPTTEATLATLATRGGGPPFQKFGKYPLYRWGLGLGWAEGRMTRLVHSTAELDAAAS